MKIIHKITATALIALFIAGCATTNRIGLKEHSGFTELPFPSNVYDCGQIVEIYSKPPKVEVAHDLQIPWDQATESKGWNITSSNTKNIKALFETEIEKILEGSAGYESDSSVSVTLTNTKTRLVPKTAVFGAIKKAIEEDPNLKDYLEAYSEDGTQLDVITQTLTATVQFSIIKNGNTKVEIDSEVLEKLNSKFNVDFERGSSSTDLISGEDLVVGIHYDPKMIDILLTD